MAFDRLVLLLILSSGLLPVYSFVILLIVDSLNLVICAVVLADLLMPLLLITRVAHYLCCVGVFY